MAFLRPPRVKANRYPQYVSEAAAFLAHATDKDRAEFSRDLLVNIIDIVRASTFGEHKRDVTAFFIFRHRYELHDAGYASSFLQLIAEPQFCSVLVSRTPWDVAAMLERLTEEKVHSVVAVDFVQEISRQAIIEPNSMMGRESGYQGFYAAPVLTNALFGSNFLRTYYEPLSFSGYGDFNSLDTERLARLRRVVKVQLSLALKGQDYWGDRSLLRIPDFLASSLRAVREHSTENQRSFATVLQIYGCVTDTVKNVRKSLDELRQSDKQSDVEHYTSLFVRDSDGQGRASLLESATEIVTETLFTIANHFSDHDDIFWHLALEVLGEVFPHYGDIPAGVDPFQQRVMIKLVSKLKVSVRRTHFSAWVEA